MNSKHKFERLTRGIRGSNSTNFIETTMLHFLLDSFRHTFVLENVIVYHCKQSRDSIAQGAPQKDVWNIKYNSRRHLNNGGGI